MKIILLLLLFFAGFAANAQTTSIDPKTKELSVTGTLTGNYHIIGYDRPSTKGKRVIAISSYDAYVHNNGYGFPLGAYYETSALKDGEKITYLGEKNGYSEFEFSASDKKQSRFFVPSKLVSK